MFRHRQSRTLIHNIKLASLLSFVAGIVNINGLMSLQLLTSNITGHFAFFAEKVIQAEFSQALGFLLLVLAFLLGAFMSNFLMEYRARNNQTLMGVAPVLLECLILSMVACMSAHFITEHIFSIACILLFAMGMQNALVTSISNSIVRTTHLTGLFTDLGIELSQLIFYREKEQKHKLHSSIKLHLSIIIFFFIGALLGGGLYFYIGSLSLLLAVVLLISGLVYRRLKLNLIYLKNHRRR